MPAPGMVIDTVKLVLSNTLDIGARMDAFEASTPLFGSVPELDSLSVVYLITDLEKQFGIVIEDDEISAAVFETVGSLADFVEKKLAS